MINKLLTWKAYLLFLYSILALSVTVLLWSIIFTDTWKGTDAGLGFIAAMAYIVGLVLFIIFSHIGHLWLRNHPRAQKVYLAAFWVIFTALTLSLGTYVVSEGQKDKLNRAIEAAFAPCTITRVTWNYQPALLRIEYSDQPSYVLTTRSDPAAVDAFAVANKSRCTTTYDVYSNGELVKDR